MWRQNSPFPCICLGTGVLSFVQSLPSSRNHKYAETQKEMLYQPEVQFCLVLCKVDSYLVIFLGIIFVAFIQLPWNQQTSLQTRFRKKLNFSDNSFLVLTLLVGWIKIPKLLAGWKIPSTNGKDVASLKWSKIEICSLVQPKCNSWRKLALSVEKVIWNLEQGQQRQRHFCTSSHSLLNLEKQENVF